MIHLSPGKTALALAIAIVSLGVALGAAAATKPSIPHGDASFLKKAAAHGAAELEVAQLARQKAMRDEVKQFADRMVQDHTRANDRITALAMSSGVELPNGPDREHAKKMRKLEKLTGPDFDREFMHLMVEDHEDAVKSFKREAKAKHPNDVTSFAAATLPTLEEHLAAARVTYDIAAAGKRSGDRETGSKR